MDTEDAMSVTEIQKETNFALEPLGFMLVTRKLILLILGYWCKSNKSLKVFYRLGENFAKKVRELIGKVTICRVLYIDKKSLNGTLLLLLLLFVSSIPIRKTTLCL